MSLPLTFIAEDFAVAPQLTPAQMAEIAAAGFRGVVNNRPDGEAGPQQPTDSDIRAAAEAAGLEYAFFPVETGRITADDVARYAELLQRLPRPLVAFCRSGNRSGILYKAATQGLGQRR